MSKTVDLQVEKSRALVKGLVKHLENGGSGVTPAEIGKMEAQSPSYATASGTHEHRGRCQRYP